MSDMIRHNLPPKENHELADDLLARFPGVDHSEILKGITAYYFYEMKWGNKREERSACDFLNELHRVALDIAKKKGVIVAKVAGLLLACLSIAATNYYGKTDLRMVPNLFPVPPNHLSTNRPSDFVGLNPPNIATVVGSNRPVVPLYRVLLSWQGSGSTDTVYRVRGMAWTNLPASLTNAWGWSVLLTTNGTSVIFSNDWRPGHGVFWSVGASNPGSRVEVPVKGRLGH